MKFFVTLLIFGSLFTTSHALTLRPFSRDQVCVYPERQVLNLTLSPITDALLNLELDKYLRFLANQGDRVINSNVDLCYGAFNEGKDLNAYSGFINGHQFIIFGQNLLRNMLSSSDNQFAGEFSYIVAHELAHFFQNNLGLEFQHPLPLFQTKLKELHADCMAGYLMTATNQISTFRPIELDRIFTFVGDPHAVGNHGVKEKRVKAFTFGMNEYLSTSLIGGYRHNSDVIAQACYRFINNENNL